MGTGKKIVILGCAGGLGSAIAARLLDHGYTVTGIDRCGTDVESLAELNPREGFYYIQYDLTDIDHLPDLMKEAADKMGGIDGMMNSAAYSLRGPMWDVTQEDYDKYMLLNLKALFFAIQAAVPYLKESGRGSIVNMSSLRSTRSDGNHILYCTVKGAVKSMTMELAINFAPLHIRVNCISPAFVLTPMTRHNLSKEGWYEKQVSAGLIGRMVEPDDVAAMAEFLLSDDSGAVTGQDHFVDGGTCIAGF